MRQDMVSMVILVSLAVLALVTSGCEARARTVLTGRVVSVHAPLQTVYVLDGGDVFALTVDPLATRVFDAEGAPVSFSDIQPGMEILAMGRWIGQYHLTAAEIRVRRGAKRGAVPP